MNHYPYTVTNIATEKGKERICSLPFLQIMQMAR